MGIQTRGGVQQNQPVTSVFSDGGDIVHKTSAHR